MVQDRGGGNDGGEKLWDMRAMMMQWKGVKVLTMEIRVMSDDDDADGDDDGDGSDDGNGDDDDGEVEDDRDGDEGDGGNDDGDGEVEDNGW